MDNLQAQIADLLRQTGEAHHRAFIETDGADPEWAIWYADYLQDRLSQQFEREITQSELVYLFVLADREHSTVSADAPWPAFYARTLVNEFLP
jgi:NAD(P)H-hydrate epimerase